MKSCIAIWVVSIIGLFSCGKDRKSTLDSVAIDPIESPVNSIIPQPLNATKDYSEYIDTKYEYADSLGKSLIIENSLPKGGLTHTDADGKKYVYAIFWTRITNNTDSSFDLKLEFSKDAYMLPGSPDNYFNVVLPTEKMEIDKASLFNYGLSSFNTTLDNKILNSYSLQGTINSNESSIFYVVTLFKKALEGTVRTGLRLEDNKLYYRVNDKEIHSGEYASKNLKIKN